MGTADLIEREKHEHRFFKTGQSHRQSLSEKRAAGSGPLTARERAGVDARSRVRPSAQNDGRSGWILKALSSTCEHATSGFLTRHRSQSGCQVTLGAHEFRRDRRACARVPGPPSNAKGERRGDGSR